LAILILLNDVEGRIARSIEIHAGRYVVKDAAVEDAAVGIAVNSVSGLTGIFHSQCSGQTKYATANEAGPDDKNTTKDV
jgi:hypothetical protein